MKVDSKKRISKQRLRQRHKDKELRKNRSSLDKKRLLMLNVRDRELRL